MLYTRQIFRSAALTGLVAFVILGVSACGGQQQLRQRQQQSRCRIRATHAAPSHARRGDGHPGGTKGQHARGSRSRHAHRRSAEEGDRPHARLSQGLRRQERATRPGRQDESRRDADRQAEVRQGRCVRPRFPHVQMGHQLSAIDMAQIKQTSGQAADAKKLAAAIVSKQETEAKEMQQLLVAAWLPSRVCSCAGGGRVCSSSPSPR